VRAICAAVTKPVNFMAGVKGKSFTVTALAQAGVRRISLGASLYRAAMGGLIGAGREVRDGGTFGYAEALMTTVEFNRFMAG
jgi:2-methylisocitrate lyase-like PEP mutase family enzyme